jgi:hypothetical protein
MTRRALLTLAASIAAALAGPSTPAHSQAQAPAQAPERSIRAGTYDLAITYGGGLLDATLIIAYRADTLSAVLKLGDHDSPVRAAKPTGTRLVLEPTSPAMDVRYELDFAGDDVTGRFVFQGAAGTLTGKRKRTER